MGYTVVMPCPVKTTDKNLKDVRIGEFFTGKLKTQNYEGLFMRTCEGMVLFATPKFQHEKFAVSGWTTSDLVIEDFKLVDVELKVKA